MFTFFTTVYMMLLAVCHVSKGLNNISKMIYVEGSESYIEALDRYYYYGEKQIDRTNNVMLIAMTQKSMVSFPFSYIYLYEILISTAFKL